MPTIPLRPAGNVRQAQAPQLSAPLAFVDLSGFAQGVFDMSRQVSIRNNTNNVNKGKNASLLLQRRVAPKIAEYVQAHAGEENFPQEFVSFMDQTVRENTEGIEIPNDEAGNNAFNVNFNSYALSTLESSLATSNKAYHDNQSAIFKENVDATVAGAEFATPQELNDIYTDLADTFRDAASDDPGAPGIISPELARVQFNENAKSIAVARLQEQIRANPSKYTEVIAMNQGMISVPKLDENMGIVTDAGGNIQYEQVPLSRGDRDAIKKALDTDLTQTRSIDENLRKIQEEKYGHRKRQLSNNAVARILDGEAGVAQELVNYYIPEYGPMFDDGAIRSMQQFEDKMVESRAQGVTTNRAGFLVMHEKMSKGELTYKDLVLAEGISFNDMKTLASSMIREEDNRTSQAMQEYNKRKSQARSILKQQFGVQGMFSSLSPDVANFLPGALIAYEERLNQKYDSLVATGGDITTINPLLEAQRIVAEREDAFFKTLAPTTAKLGKQLVRYYEATKGLQFEEGRKPTLYHVGRELRNDYDRGRIGPAEFEQQLFILKSLVEQNVSYERLGTMITGSGGVIDLGADTGAIEQPATDTSGGLLDKANEFITKKAHPLDAWSEFGRTLWKAMRGHMIEGGQEQSTMEKLLLGENE